MSHCRWLATVLVVLVLTSRPAAAAPPEYLVLRTPPAPLHPTQPHYTGQGREVSRQTYAYGWFGVAPRQHWSRHFGYARLYTQWTGK